MYSECTRKAVVVSGKMLFTLPGAVLSVDTQKQGIFCDTLVFIFHGNWAANCCTVGRRPAEASKQNQIDMRMET